MMAKLKLGKYNFRLEPIILFVFINLVLLLWFKDQKIIASGEDGFFLTNPKRALEIFESVWVDGLTGFATSDFLPRLPMAIYTNFLHQMGIQGYIIQYSIFLILMFSGCYFTYKIYTNLFESKNNLNISGLLMSIFYLINPYSLTQLWNRQLYSQYSLFALLPAALYFYSKGLKDKKYYNILGLLAFAFIFSAAYGLVTNIIVIWSVLFIYTVIHSIQNRNQLLFNIKYFLITFISWISINLWWILPLKEILTGQSVFTEKMDPIANLQTLEALGTYFTLPIIIRLLQGFYFYIDIVIKDFYLNFFIQIFSWILPLLLAIYSKKIILNQKLLFFLSIFLIGLFVSLGSNAPFGPIFVYFFNKITFLQAFRNPYEKYGMVYMLGYTFLFGYIIEQLLNYRKGLTFTISFFIGWLIFNLPLYYGPRIDVNKINVPTYYEEANIFINNKNLENGERIITLPLTGEGIAQTWGYQGVEPSLFLFNKPVISYQIQSPVLKDFLSRFNEKVESGENFSTGFSLLNAKNILIRDDVVGRSKPKDYFLYTKTPNKNVFENISCATIRVEDMLIDKKNVLSCKTEGLNLKDTFWLDITEQIPFEEIELNIIDNNGKRAIWRNPESLTDNGKNILRIQLDKAAEIPDTFMLENISYINVVINKNVSLANLNLDEMAFKINSYELKRNDFNTHDLKEIEKLKFIEIDDFNEPLNFGYIEKAIPVDSLKTLVGYDLSSISLKSNVLVVTGQGVNKDIDFNQNASIYETKDYEMKRLSNTSYWIQNINESTGTSKVILLNSYNPQWVLISDIDARDLENGLMNNIKIIQKSKSQKNSTHLIANGYANYWELPSKINNKGYAVVFIPQVYTNLGIQISTIFAAIIILLFGFTYLKIDRNR